ncbi:MAG: hypothetical protein ACR2GK_00455 [Gemmatimonadaceae bacterium]
MFGFFRRLGCLVFLIILAIVGWFNRDRLEGIYRRYAGDPRPDTTAVAVPGSWEPLSAEKATRAQRAIESLSAPRGPAYATLTAGEASSYIFLAVSKQLPASSEEISSSIKDDRLFVRANIALRDVGGPGVLGPIAAMLGTRDTVQLGGTMRVLRPGVGEFQVKEVRIGAFPVPSAIVPRLIRAMRKGEMPEGVSDDALPMTLPAYIGDVRIANGRITVYKATE